MAHIIHDFLCYNILMGQNVSDLLERSLDSSRLELLHLLAYQASSLQMSLYLVGGVVRDVLLGRAVKDFDLVVEGNSAQLAESVLKRYGGRIMVHSRFGTATWVVNESTFKRLNVPALQFPDADMSFDLISARSETYAQPGALPTVQFSTIDDDLRRRDFTINAMAIRLDGHHFGDLFDPLNGMVDLENKNISVLHNRSFIDDPTRMFRAARYAERYGFRIARETWGLFTDEARGVLSQLSGERLRHEIDLIFEEKNSVAMLDRLKDLRILHVVHPALQTASTERVRLTTDKPESEFGDFSVPDILSFRQTLGWILFLMDTPAVDIEAIASRLSFPTLLTKAVLGVSSLGRKQISFKDWRPSQWTFQLDQLPELAVYALYLMDMDPGFQDYLTHWRFVKPYTTGYNLKERGLEPGPKFKEILTRLRAAWLDGEVMTEEEEKTLVDRLIE